MGRAQHRSSQRYVPTPARPRRHCDDLRNRAVKTLSEALHGHDAEVRVAAAKALCKMGDPAGRETLVAVLVVERKDAPGVLTNAVREARKKAHHPDGVLLAGGQEASGLLLPGSGMGIVVVKDAFQLRGTSRQASAVEALAKDP